MSRHRTDVPALTIRKVIPRLQATVLGPASTQHRTSSYQTCAKHPRTCLGCAHPALTSAVPDSCPVPRFRKAPRLHALATLQTYTLVTERGHKRCLCELLRRPVASLVSAPTCADRPGALYRQSSTSDCSLAVYIAAPQQLWL